MELITAANHNVHQVTKIVDEILEGTGNIATIFRQLEELSGVNRKIIFWGLVAFTLLWLAMGIAGQLLTNFIGILYPAYASIYAIESTDTNDDRKWLTYWIVYSYFTFIESFIYFLVGWIPFYWLTKCVFLVWLMIPTDFNGSLMLYNGIIKPYFLQYHDAVDNVVSEIEQSAVHFMETNKQL